MEYSVKMLKIYRRGTKSMRVVKEFSEKSSKNLLVLKEIFLEK